MKKTVWPALLACFILLLLMNLAASVAAFDRVPKNVQEPDSYQQNSNTDTLDILDINAPIFAPEQRPYWRSGLAALVFIALCIVVCWWLMKRKKTGPAAVPHVPLVVAERALSGLLESTSQRDAKVYVLRCESILRAYLESLARAAKNSLTSAELMELLRHSRPPVGDAEKTDHAALAELLAVSDQIKFAHYQPTATQVALIAPALQAFFKQEQQVALQVEG